MFNVFISNLYSQTFKQQRVSAERISVYMMGEHVLWAAAGCTEITEWRANSASHCHGNMSVLIWWFITCVSVIILHSNQLLGLLHWWKFRWHSMNSCSANHIHSTLTCDKMKSCSFYSSVAFDWYIYMSCWSPASHDSSLPQQTKGKRVTSLTKDRPTQSHTKSQKTEIQQ